jgi:hypothetical protein
MPEACRAETEAEAAAPTKREATAKAFKGMRRDSPAQPLLTDDTPQPNWATLARAHHQWLKVLPLSFSSSILRDRNPPLSVASVELSRPARSSCFFQPLCLYCSFFVWATLLLFYVYWASSVLGL